MSKVFQDILFEKECYSIIGICMKIHTKLGKGFREVVYKDALEIELENNKIPYQREKPFKIEYEGVILQHQFRADFVVFDSIILEIKANSTIHPDSFYQTLNYLKAAQIKLGVLINFGESRLKYHRVVCSF
jgi:GxxExxY protein